MGIMWKSYRKQQTKLSNDMPACFPDLQSDQEASTMIRTRKHSLQGHERDTERWK